GPVVGLGRAHAGVVSDRLLAVRDLPAASLRDRGPRAPGALCLGLRDHRRGLRADELHRRAPGHRLRSPARARQHLEPAAADGLHLSRLAAGDHAAVPDAVRVRAGGQESARAACSAAPQGRAAMSELLALGISHKTAPVALRERLAFGERDAGEFAREATGTAEVREAVVISTCNRTEVYVVVGDPVRAEADVLGMLARRAG